MKEEQDRNKQAKSAEPSSKSEGDAKRTDMNRHGRVEAQATSTSAWKRLMARKWVFPAVYLAAAAVILSLMWVYQNNNSELAGEEPNLIVDQPDLSEGTDGDALPVTGSAEDLMWPVAAPEHAEVVRPYYDENAPGETKQAAMIHYDNTFMPNTGIDIVSHHQETFDVLAAMSGTVTRVGEDQPLIGNVVEIEHEDGLKTIYHSLSNIAVEEGALVVQGEVIAQSGRSEIGKDFGSHLHFEIHKDDAPLNPEHYLPVVSESGAMTSRNLELDNGAGADTVTDAVTGTAEDNAKTESDAAEDIDIESDANRTESDKDSESEQRSESERSSEQESDSTDADLDDDVDAGFESETEWEAE